jgi:hypothetical protein
MERNHIGLQTLSDLAFPKSMPLFMPTHPLKNNTVGRQRSHLPPPTASQTLPILRSPLGALFLRSMEPDMVDRVHSVDASDHRQSRSLSLGRRGAKSLECQHRTTCQEDCVGGTHLVGEKTMAVFWVEMGSRSLFKPSVSLWRDLNVARTEPPGISPVSFVVLIGIVLHHVFVEACNCPVPLATPRDPAPQTSLATTSFL